MAPRILTKPGSKDGLLGPHDFMGLAHHNHASTAWTHILFGTLGNVVDLVRVAVASLFSVHTTHSRLSVERANWTGVLLGTAHISILATRLSSIRGELHGLSSSDHFAHIQIFIPPNQICSATHLNASQIRAPYDVRRSHACHPDGLVKGNSCAHRGANHVDQVRRPTS